MIATLTNRERVKEETFKWVWPRAGGVSVFSTSAAAVTSRKKSRPRSAF